MLVHVIELRPTTRTFTCPNCSVTIDRDMNAAINLSKYQQSPTIKGRLKTHRGDVSDLLVSNVVEAVNTVLNNNNKKSTMHNAEKQTASVY